MQLHDTCFSRHLLDVCPSVKLSTLCFSLLVSEPCVEHLQLKSSPQNVQAVLIAISSQQCVNTVGTQEADGKSHFITVSSLWSCATE